MSSCTPGSLKGSIFFYHGYSACPDQYNQLAEKLQDECYHVYQILTIGHGYEYCTDNSSDSGCTAAMYNLTALPNTRQPYIDYITETMLPAIRDEVSIIQECEVAANSLYDTNEMEVVVGGLSFGAPLAAASVVLSGSDSIFTKHILMSPFFGITYQGFDNLVYKCLLNRAAFKDCLPIYFEAIGFNTTDDADVFSDIIEDALTYYVDLEFLDVSFETFNLMLRKVIGYIVENPDAITDDDIRENINDLLDTVFGWGAQCELDITDRNRGGVCQFSIRNLFASHSFGQYVTDIMGSGDIEIDQSVETLLVLVERDGPTRNSLAANYVNLFYGQNSETIYSQANDCMWFISQACQLDTYDGPIDNTCGVPHSSMSNPDNLGIPPENLYWEDTYHEGLIDWINNEASYGDNFIVQTGWDGSRNQCIYLDIIDPPESLIADVPSLMRIGLSIVGGQVTDSVQESILDGVAALTGVPRGVLQLTYNLFTNSDVDTEDGDYYEFQMGLDSDGTNLMTTLLDNNGINEIANYSITYVNVDGNEYYVTTEPTTTADDNESGMNRLVMNGWLFILIGIYALIL
eukprot:CAMPEP_0201566122 /NCGR_PEP_ID=MMETSP0190_2-20130828/5670_1 /ASSEMBLY_ACC=CAM_ASM_000263 /TAXON_ID=37353 /ORGANISM="Rosalina sp." /LENGTH=574 /DNA_ID=CAMNT_0047984401 /DNA_START=250 /DNA_END=1974 /DNA_ORIENTATION=+